MPMRSRSNVFGVHSPPALEVVIETEALGVDNLETASSTFRLGSSKTSFSLAPPPFAKKPSPVVGMGLSVQLQVVQFRFTVTALSTFPQPLAITFCPERI